MDVNQACALLGGLSPAQFMRRHWQKKPLLVRQALPGLAPPLPRAELFDLAARDDVESRLVQQRGRGWALRSGPLPRSALPPLKRPGWTLLVQGLDLHVPAAHELLQRFAFIPAARLDDLMLSYASDGGGVGPHLDSYDVFLIQVAGVRRWRIGRARDASFVEGVPLKILRHFEPEDEWELHPGDMLYLPPRWAHEGTALGGDCMTASVGFRAQRPAGLARELLLRLGDSLEDDETQRLYADPQQSATAEAGAVPAALQAFAAQALARALMDPRTLNCALGEVLSEPKPQVWFEAGGAWPRGTGLRLDRRSRMLHDAQHVFINGESFLVGGRDAKLMRRLADTRQLGARDCAQLSGPARELVAQWVADGWARPWEA